MNKTLEEIESKFRKKFKTSGNYFSDGKHPNHPVHIPFIGEVFDFFGEEFETYFQKRLKEILPEKEAKNFRDDIEDMAFKVGRNSVIDEILNNS